jgi:hypothetical protein
LFYLAEPVSGLKASTSAWSTATEPDLSPANSTSELCASAWKKKTHESNHAEAQSSQRFSFEVAIRRLHGENRVLSGPDFLHRESLPT